MSLIVWLSSFWGAVPPQDLLFKAQIVFGQWHGAWDLFPIVWLLSPLQAHGVCHGEFVGVWYNPPARFPHIYISATVLHAKEAFLINHSTYFTFLDSLCNSVHGQVHSSVLSPSICWWSFLMAWGFMGLLSWKLLCCQSRFTWTTSILVAQSTCWLSWFSLLAQLCGTWASM